MNRSANQNETRIIRLNDVKARTGLSRSTIYHYISTGNFPSQIKLGSRAVGWKKDIHRRINSKIPFSC